MTEASYLAVRRAPFEARFLELPRVVPAPRWREIVVLARWESPGHAFSSDVAAPRGDELALSDEACEVIRDACENECGVASWRATFPKSPWNLFTEYGSGRDFEKVLPGSESQAALCTWLRLAATLGPVPGDGRCPVHGQHEVRRAPWWVGSADCLTALTRPEEVRALAADLAAGRMVQAVTALAAGDGYERYARDVADLAGFVGRAAGEGCWLVASAFTS